MWIFGRTLLDSVGWGLTSFDCPTRMAWKLLYHYQHRFFPQYSRQRVINEKASCFSKMLRPQAVVNTPHVCNVCTH